MQLLALWIEVSKVCWWWEGMISSLLHFGSWQLFVCSHGFDVYFQDDGSRGIFYAPFSANTGFYYVRCVVLCVLFWNYHVWSRSWLRNFHFYVTTEPTTAQGRSPGCFEVESTCWLQSVLWLNFLTLHRNFFNSLLMSGDLVISTKSHQIALVALLSEHSSLHGMKTKVLSRDTDEFPGGHAFHYRRDFMRDLFAGKVNPYIFHMSWTLNKDNKQKFFRQIGDW